MPRWEPFTDYFWRMVYKSKSCWLWRGGVLKGYGRVHYMGKREGAHRVAWKLTNGEIPLGFFVCHKCDVRNCVNPKHLFIGTQKDNMQDWTKKGKNRLINDRSLWKYGDDNWMRQIRSKKFRSELSRKLKKEIRSGERKVLRDSVSGQIKGTAKTSCA